MLEVLALAEKVVAVECLVAAQAVDLTNQPLARDLAEAHERIREEIVVLKADREIGSDIEALVALLREDFFYDNGVDGFATIRQRPPRL